MKRENSDKKKADYDMTENEKKMSENDDSARMRRDHSVIIGSKAEYSGYGPMSFVLPDSYNKLPHKKTTSDAKKLVAICASTGGPKAIARIIPDLPQDLNAPVIMVQHMPQGYTYSLAQRMNEKSPLNIKEAVDGDRLEKGSFYLAQGGKHLSVIKRKTGHYISIGDGPARSGLKPCADIMYESLAETDYDEIICVVLTGMGSDGTRGIGYLCEKKNVYVIAQNKETSTVYGMPYAVNYAGIADQVLPLDKIAEAIVKAAGTKNS